MSEGRPAGHWKTLSILSAIGTVGLVATMIIEAPTDGEVFLCYLEQVLGPQLTPGQTVVMDNLAAHKVHGVREMIGAAVRSSSICRRTHRTSTLSRRPGPNSNSTCAGSRRELLNNFTRPLRKHCPPSLLAMHRLGSITAAMF